MPYSVVAIVSPPPCFFTAVNNHYTTDCDSGVAGNCHNNSNQHGIAKALKATSIPRSDIFVTTKVPGCGLQGISRGNCGPDSVAAALENLDELGLDYVDLLLIHFPPPLGCGILNCGTIQKQWAALSEQILKANKTRALGVSNFCVSCLKCLAEVTDAVVPAVNQVQFHVGMGADPEGLMSYAKAQGIAVEAYSPLGDNTTELIDGDLTTRIGAAHNKSSVQVALKWIWQRGHALTTKSSNPKHLAQDIDIFDWQLSSDELTQLDAATKPSGNPSFMCTSR
jgi:2,5-diketo-D-gluconate reductase A